MPMRLQICTQTQKKYSIHTKRTAETRRDSSSIFTENFSRWMSRTVRELEKCHTICEANYRKETLEELHSTRRVQ